MKTVFSGNEVPHIFATQSQPRGRNSNDTLWFEGATLYSYREPIARFHDGRVLISADSFSVTTSKHQSWARYALRHLETVAVPDLRRLCEVLTYKRERGALDFIDYRMRDIAAVEERIKKMRADWKIRQAQGEITQHEAAAAIAWAAVGKRSDWRKAAAPQLAKTKKAESVARYNKSLGALSYFVQHGAQDAIALMHEKRAETAGARHRFFILENTISDIYRADSIGAGRGDGVAGSATWAHACKIMPKAFCAAYKALAARLATIAAPLHALQEQERATLDEVERAEKAEQLAAWLALAPGARAPSLTEVVCRVVDDTVETNKGARVPLVDALRVVDLAKRCRAKGETFRKDTFATGYYKGISVDAEGNVTIGCHRLTWRAISECVALFKPELAE